MGNLCYYGRGIALKHKNYHILQKGLQTNSLVCSEDMDINTNITKNTLLKYWRFFEEIMEEYCKMGPGVHDIMLNGIQGHKYYCYDQTR